LDSSLRTAAQIGFAPRTLHLVLTSSLLRWLSLAVIALGAFWLRTHELARRPMHADEANQAVKTGELLESGRYVFDPRDHHGPTLYYAALPVAWLRGERTLAALSETTVRLVPALFGTLAVLLVASLATPLGCWVALGAAAFVALSPPAVYYSRYFVQETLLLTFALGAFVAVREWSQHRHNGWAIAAGICVGLMLATKANAPLFLLAATLAAIVGRGFSPSPVEKKGRLKPALLFALVAACLTAALFYSSFFTHSTGVRDALTAFTHGWTRATGETGHEKPWWYYLQLFGWQRTGGLVWHQLVFSALSVGGVLLALFSWDRGRSRPHSDPAAEGGRAPTLLRAIAVYTLAVALALSLTPYKTPWHAIHLVPGLAILAAGALAAIASWRNGKIVATLAAFAVFGTLAHQAWRAAFVRPADARNPYAYVHSSPDVLKYRALAEAALVRFPRHPILVISEEYWPLPWYFRGLSRIGYWSTPPADCDGALVIVSAAQAEAVRARLRGNYRESFLGLRPGVVCIVFTPES
jgi:uncharacterized protein (TIGR03663 family)